SWELSSLPSFPFGEAVSQPFVDFAGVPRDRSCADLEGFGECASTDVPVDGRSTQASASPDVGHAQRNALLRMTLGCRVHGVSRSSSGGRSESGPNHARGARTLVLRYRGATSAICWRGFPLASGHAVECVTLLITLPVAPPAYARMALRRAMAAVSQRRRTLQLQYEPAQPKLGPGSWIAKQRADAGRRAALGARHSVVPHPPARAACLIRAWRSASLRSPSLRSRPSDSHARPLRPDALPIRQARNGDTGSPEGRRDPRGAW